METSSVYLRELYHLPVLKHGKPLDIYGQRHGKKPIPKDPDFYSGSSDGIAEILLAANDVDHSRIRRLMSHAFSESALREQEPILNSYFDLLIQKLHEKVSGSENGKVNMVHWFNFTTFDLIGDLAFGEPFDVLKSEEYNFWIANVFQFIKFIGLQQILHDYPILDIPMLAIMTLFSRFRTAEEKHRRYTEEKASRRLDTQTNRRDYMWSYLPISLYILRHNDEKGMSRAEIIKASGTLIIAGSETTATLLSGALYYLLKTPSSLSKLTTELRTSFPDPADMNFVNLARLSYLNACLQEGLRLYPPVPGILPRKTQPGGAVINGHHIPENVSVGMSHFATYHSASNFTDPETFAPERWLDDRHFASDKRSALQPFSVGPRNCIGQHLAMAEMRAILARILWHFDISLCEESARWNEQKVFIFWDKPDLMVTLKERKN
ncbi:Cytochrome P450 monooxygenase [Lachnellula hyalina]|uniref:Cytochrome P450 monooxygenase n=1 Tax=Lachnellula hyalina TaxID=1316788 RepID=A0A8H8QX94_9HELO|nr:Cytochrome P450 monooxygenase [Lachnellula hyalina]TVY24378.1 Cytochrome P450 monooxygenase [Lachnellula hyalina]